jgi:phage tail sheath protein FI
MSDFAVRQELTDPSLAGKSENTVASYRKALDVLTEKSDTDIQLLAIPGLRHPAVTDYAVDAVESRFDAMYVMDLEEMDNDNIVVTGSTVSTEGQLVSVKNTANRLVARNLDTSFAATYFPDVVMNDPSTGTNIVCPPSVAVMGALSLNDRIGHPWFAPAGFTRGALASVTSLSVALNQDNLDLLYGTDINPLRSHPQNPEAGVVVWGQKTLQQASSALDRVNVRRLLIDLRRKVKAVALTFLFEPNREETLSKFSAQVTPILTNIQAQRGVSRFKVQIDTTTTTQADVENNTIRGKIYLQPVKSLEFVELDFVVANQGANI